MRLDQPPAVAWLRRRAAELGMPDAAIEDALAPAGWPARERMDSDATEALIWVTSVDER